MVESHIDEAPAPRWFARIGSPLPEDERAQLATLAAVAEIVAVATWTEASRALDAEDRDNRHWDAQEEERERLWDVCCDRHLEAALLEQLDAERSRWERAIHDAAHDAARRLAIADARFVLEACGAAQLAVNLATLADLAGADHTHPFRSTLELFRHGRWPLGAAGGRIMIF